MRFAIAGVPLFADTFVQDGIQFFEKVSVKTPNISFIEVENAEKVIEITTTLL